MAATNSKKGGVNGMSDLWAYEPDICDGDFCPCNCDYCSKAYDRDMYVKPEDRSFENEWRDSLDTDD